MSEGSRGTVGPIDCRSNRTLFPTGAIDWRSGRWETESVESLAEQDTAMNDSPMTEQDRRYAEGSSRFAFAHARHYMDAVASGDKENAAYHRREIVEIAEWLEAGLTRLARKPSTMTAPVHPCGILPPVGPRREVFQRVFAAGREAFPAVHGLTCIDADRAFFQVTGDRTFYSVALLDGEAAALGYMKV